MSVIDSLLDFLSEQYKDVDGNIAAARTELKSLRSERAALLAELAEYRTLRPAKCRPECWRKGWKAALEAAVEVADKFVNATRMKLPAPFGGLHDPDQDGFETASPFVKWVAQSIRNSLNALVPPADCGQCNQLAPDDVLKSTREYLKSLPNDWSRHDFISGLDVCVLCGQVGLPCYCAPQYDE